MDFLQNLLNKCVGRMASALVGMCLFLPTCAPAQATAVQLRHLYETHSWLKLREVAQHSAVPLFYRAAIAVAFNQIQSGEEDLHTVLSTEPNSEHAYEAREMLTNLYFRNGLYHEALAQLRLMLVQKPEAEDVKATIPLMEALSHAPDLAVSSRKVSTFPLQMKQGNLFVPLKVGAGSATYILDSGANFCLMSESEAKRLGLHVGSTSAITGDASGSGIGIRIATATDLTIGTLHLTNVPFGILPDSQEPFVDLPKGYRGILGIPILLAMQVIHWTAKGSFTLGTTEEDAKPNKPNISFVGMFPVTEVSFQQKQLDFTIDMGAVHTDLNPAFAKEFPLLLARAGKQEQHRITGVGGSLNYEAIFLPSISLSVGHRKVILKPVNVLLRPDNGPSNWAAGNLGMDLLNQSDSVTLNFKSMTLRMH